MNEPQHAFPTVSRKKTAAVNLAFHYFSIVLTVTQGILLAPLYLKYLGSALYGAWLATGNVLAWIELVDPGLGTVLQQRTAAALGSRQHPELRKVIGNGIFLSLFLSLLPLLAWPVSHFLPGLFQLGESGSEALLQAFQLALISSATAFASFSVTAVNIGLQRATATGVIYVVAASVGLGSTLVWLLKGMGLSSLPLGMLLRNGVLLLGNVGVFWAWKQRHLPGALEVSWEGTSNLSKLLSFSFLSRVGGTLLERVESFLTATLISPQWAAVLSLTGRPFDPLKLATTRIGAALSPSLAHLSGEGDWPKIDAWVNRMNWVVTTVTWVGIVTLVGLNQDLIALWVGPEMFAGTSVTWVLGMACALQIMTSHLSQILFALGKIKDVSKIATLEGLVKAPALYFLLNKFGILGAPLATIFATLLVSGWCYPKLYAETLGLRKAPQLFYWVKHHVWTMGLALAMLLGLQALRARGVTLHSWWSLLGAASLTGVGLLLCFALVSPEVRSWVSKSWVKTSPPP